MKKIQDTYHDIETFDIIKRGVLLKRFKGMEVNGKNKPQIEELIGKELGEGVFSAAVKKIGVNKKSVEKIRGVVENTNPKEKFESANMDNALLKQLSADFNKLVSSKEGNSSQLLEFQRQLSQSTIDWYKEQNKALEAKVTKLEDKLEVLEDKLETAKASEGGSSGLDQILGLIPMFFNKKNIPVGTLKDENTLSDASDIPPSFIDALGKVDYSRVSPEQQNQILNYFNMFSKQLPLKENVNG